MFLIHNLLAITNGQNYDTGHIGGTYANGTRYYLHKLGYGTRLVIETPVLVEDTSDEGVLKDIEDGKLDIFPLNNFGGRDTVAAHKRGLFENQEAARKVAAFDVKVAELNSRYPQVTEELRKMVKYHDWYYEYSDAGSVYRAGVAREKAIKAALKEVGAEGYFSEYSCLFNNGR